MLFNLEEFADTQVEPCVMAILDQRVWLKVD